MIAPGALPVAEVVVELRFAQAPGIHGTVRWILMNIVPPVHAKATIYGIGQPERSTNFRTIRTTLSRTDGVTRCAQRQSVGNQLAAVIIAPPRVPWYRILQFVDSFGYAATWPGRVQFRSSKYRREITRSFAFLVYASRYYDVVDTVIGRCIDKIMTIPREYRALRWAPCRGMMDSEERDSWSRPDGLHRHWFVNLD